MGRLKKLNDSRHLAAENAKKAELSAKWAAKKVEIVNRAVAEASKIVEAVEAGVTHIGWAWFAYPAMGSDQLRLLGYVDDVRKAVESVYPSEFAVRAGIDKSLPGVGFKIELADGESDE